MQIPWGLSNKPFSRQQLPKIISQTDAHAVLQGLIHRSLTLLYAA